MTILCSQNVRRISFSFVLIAGGFWPGGCSYETEPHGLGEPTVLGENTEISGENFQECFRDE